jgi:hypothetical protein
MSKKDETELMKKECPVCLGDGTILHPAFPRIVITCPACSGVGKIGYYEMIPISYINEFREAMGNSLYSGDEFVLAWKDI